MLRRIRLTAAERRSCRRVDGSYGVDEARIAIAGPGRDLVVREAVPDGDRRVGDERLRDADGLSRVPEDLDGLSGEHVGVHG